MGANQSTSQRYDAGGSPRSSTFCGACGGRPASPDLAPDTEPVLEKSQDASQRQPARRSKMTILGGRPDSMAAPPARSLSARRASKKRPKSRAKADLRHSDSLAPPLPAVKAPLRPRQSSEEVIQDPTFLPQNKRLSPMPDFANSSDQSIDALASTPWVAVRQMAERMPSRRSSALSPPTGAAPSSQPTLTRKLSSGNNSILSRPSVTSSHPQKDSQPSISSPYPPRKDSQHSNSSHPTRKDSHQEQPLPQYPSAKSVNLRVRTVVPHDEDVPMPLRSGKSVADSFDTTKVNLPSSLHSSPKMPAPKTFPLKSAMKGGRKASSNGPMLSPKSPGAHSTVEDAVRELQEIVEAKRGTASFETMRSGTTVASKRFSEQPQFHRAAVAPGMVVQASPGLLDDIGSALSRPVSDATVSSHFRDEMPVSPTTSSGMPKLKQQWQMRSSRSSTDPNANSGTFFLGGPTSRPSSPARAARNGDESPVDRPWTLDRPISTDLDLDDVSSSSRPRRQPTWRSDGRLSRSSSIAVANPVSHLSSISSFRDTASWRAFDAELEAASVTSFSFIDAGMSVSSRGRRPSATPSIEHSAAVQAARSRMIGPGAGPGPTLSIPLRSPSMRSYSSRDDSSIVSVRSPWGGWTAPRSPAPTRALPQPAGARASPPVSPFTALPPLAPLSLTPSNPSNLSANMPRTLAGAIRAPGTGASPQQQRVAKQNEARPRTARTIPRSVPLATVGEGSPMRLTAKDVVRRQSASTRRLWEVEQEIEAVEMERGLARLSQVGVAF